jgi:hypothetical protein
VNNLKRIEFSTSLLRVLSPADVLTVDRALAAVGAFGEVRLIVKRGRLRFIQKVESIALADGPESGAET